MAYSTQSAAAGRLQYLNQRKPPGGRAPDSNMPNKRFKSQPKQSFTFGKTGGTLAPVTYEPTRGTT